MSPCPTCFPWNLPLIVKERLAADGTTVGLRYEEWLSFHLHVVLHQAGRWAGELVPVLDQTQESIV